MRTVVNLPMTPHQMRHGQIDDRPGTLRQFYGWLNSMKLVEHGQDRSPV